MEHSPIRSLAQPLPLLIGLGGCFFGSLAWAAAFFPHGYDWRHDVISSLASPRDNPRAYGIACAGLALSGLLLIPFSFVLQKRLESSARRLTRMAGILFRLAAVCLFLSALIVPGHYRLFGIARSHEHLAQVSSVALSLALILYFGAILRLRPSLRSLRIAAAVVVVLPVTALAVSRLSLFCAYEFSSPAVYHAVRRSVWSSLALWEWIGAVCIYLFLALTTWLVSLPEAQSEIKLQRKPGGPRAR
jgi:hypothetical protein